MINVLPSGKSSLSLCVCVLESAGWFLAGLSIPCSTNRLDLLKGAGLLQLQDGLPTSILLNLLSLQSFVSTCIFICICPKFDILFSVIYYCFQTSLILSDLSGQQLDCKIIVLVLVTVLPFRLKKV